MLAFTQMQIEHSALHTCLRNRLGARVAFPICRIFVSHSHSMPSTRSCGYRLKSFQGKSRRRMICPYELSASAILCEFHEGMGENSMWAWGSSGDLYAHGGWHWDVE